MRILKSKYVLMLLCAVGVVLGGCRGSEGEIGEIVLTADVQSVAADGLSKVKLTATSDGRDVTSQVTFHHTSELFALEGGEFTTVKTGKHKVSASYEGVVSNEVEIEAVAPERLPVSRFVRHICVMDFTATDCAFCPDGQNHMLQVNKQMEDEATACHLMALHNPGVDPMGIALTSQMMNDYKVEEQPYYLIDMRDKGGVNSNEEKSAYRKCLMRSTDLYPAHVGVAVRTKFNKDNGKSCQVEVSLLSERNDHYRVALYVVEDGIVADQNVNGFYKSYTHNHVVRALVNESYRGDNLGAVAAEQSASKTYSFDMADEWVVEKTSVYVLVMDSTGFVNNMAVCAVNNGTADYDYLEK
ncbi:MAG: Omp28-related outer membrane protein [Tidjanibacter sp.]|nr:Omp28-related outer membrane protein [Tidjanibacter sp.]